MPDDHRTTMPQVTVVDDQFGTHKESCDFSEGLTAWMGQGLAADARASHILHL